MLDIKDDVRCIFLCLSQNGRSSLSTTLVFWSFDKLSWWVIEWMSIHVSGTSFESWTCIGWTIGFFLHIDFQKANGTLNESILYHCILFQGTMRRDWLIWLCWGGNRNEIFLEQLGKYMKYWERKKRQKLILILILFKWTLPQKIRSSKIAFIFNKGYINWDKYIYIYDWRVITLINNLFELMSNQETHTWEPLDLIFLYYVNKYEQRTHNQKLWVKLF